MTKKMIIAAVSLALLLTACYKNSLEELSGEIDCSNTEMSFAMDIMPIVQSTCTESSCHETNAVLTFPLSSYEDVKSVVDDGRFLKSIKHQKGVVAMPKDLSKLSDCIISKFESWIADGALDN